VDRRGLDAEQIAVADASSPPRMGRNHTDGESIPASTTPILLTRADLRLPRRRARQRRGDLGEEIHRFGGEAEQRDVRERGIGFGQRGEEEAD
jgi:hypothetical protein